MLTKGYEKPTAEFNENWAEGERVFFLPCKILTSRELQKSELNEAFTKLVNMNKLIEGKYGQVKISPNLHLCLHICECALDYGPLSSFWCFSFERMNGIIGT